MHLSSGQESSVFLVQLLTQLVLWASWKELKEQACYMACPVGKRVFCFPCPTFNSSCLLGKLERTERTSMFYGLSSGQMSLLFLFSCPTLNSSCPLCKLERTERTSMFYYDLSRTICRGIMS